MPNPEIVRFDHLDASLIRESNHTIATQTHEVRLGVMNAAVSRVVGPRSERAGYCDQNLFSTAFLGGFYDSANSWSSTAENERLRAVGKTPVEFDAAVEMARLIPFATNDLYCFTSNGLSPEPEDVGLVLPNHPDTSDVEVSYQLSRSRSPRIIKGSISFLGLQKSPHKDNSFFTEQITLLRLFRDKDRTALTVTHSPSVAIGTLAVRKILDIDGRYNDTEIDQLEDRRQELVAFAKTLRKP